MVEGGEVGRKEITLQSSWSPGSDAGEGAREMSAMPTPGELPATGGRSSQPHGQRAVNTTRFSWVLVRSTAVLGAGSEPAFLCTSRSAASGTPGVDVSGRGRHGVNVAPTKAIATSNAMALFLCIERSHSTGLVDGPPCSAERCHTYPLPASPSKVRSSETNRRSSRRAYPREGRWECDSGSGRCEAREAPRAAKRLALSHGASGWPGAEGGAARDRATPSAQCSVPAATSQVTTVAATRAFSSGRPTYARSRRAKSGRSRGVAATRPAPRPSSRAPMLVPRAERESGYPNREGSSLGRPAPEHACSATRHGSGRSQAAEAPCSLTHS